MQTMFLLTVFYYSLKKLDEKMKFNKYGISCFVKL